MTPLTQHKKTHVFTGLLALSLFTAPAFAQSAVSQEDWIRIHVAQNDVPTFVDAKSERMKDSRQDLIDAIRGQVRQFRFVDDPAEADVIIKLVSADFEETGDVRTSQRRVLGGGVSGTQKKDEAPIVRVTMTVGDYETTFETQNMRVIMWRQSAGDVAGQIAKWMKNNAAQVLAQRK